jgi:hypothetical protein
MAITTAMANTFKQELLEAGHNFSTDGSTFVMVLIKATPTGSYTSTTANYSELTGNSDETSGTGYTAGGSTLASTAPSLDSGTAITDFADLQWTSATFSADGCMMINADLSNAVCATYDFGGTKSVSAGTFDLIFPAASAAASVLRLA